MNVLSEIDKKAIIAAYPKTGSVHFPEEKKEIGLK